MGAPEAVAARQGAIQSQENFRPGKRAQGTRRGWLSAIEMLGKFWRPWQSWLFCKDHSDRHPQAAANSCWLYGLLRPEESRPSV
jgi:hypothetical protein